ncbi:type II toxin-antitoxin system VapC family toxin [Rhodoferax sp.]|jgi:tRNA(fMet)-specific endonuclease VapC|uniref:type II toxin-antitoxin system VapC family toxin n=1 Tax=Rhodoferax sp. TaxID=50421 RepID=UPI0027232353|nr:type II toxin-antitoxin system VapC family toxin [Rhodoferax sp.]MDO9145127.1 type II toxin-antitoxin system VapC family toxin [Rhodoferax sp.]MDP1528807.1 type II toxin-antitoxin system VapC family toxin [Rhodoferax sp.]MDP1943708.1 type II toxin-antitoxin system VapC family toxin [Rhodoferax sp.]MDP2440855.1 type II toxin-antitoxin system VapC family toxin [Rhodoferax sp.]MDP3192600.1 type II toxin-antitoxin system VapC family toxin [Rhodoferax sp.]
MTYLLDTNIVSYFLRDASATLSQRILDSSPDTLAISIISAGELRYGLSKLPPSRRATELAQRLSAVFTAISVLPLPAEAAPHYGRTRAQLEAAGTPIGNNDLWIAAHALAKNMTLVTNNVGEFQRVQELMIENWL